MRAGDLNRRITFQRNTVAYDSYNQPINTPSDDMTVFAQVLTSGGREFYAAQKLYAETSAVFKIRYTERVNPRMQIKYGIHTFEILGIADPDGRRTELLISSKEVV